MLGGKEIELLDRALQGDHAARCDLAKQLIGAIQREVSLTLQRFARSENRDTRQEVVDLVQDVLVILFERDGQELRRWDPTRGRSLVSFVRLIARRRVARILSQGRGNPWSDLSIDMQAYEPTEDEDLLQSLEGRHHLDRLLGVLYAKMNHRDHELFDLVFVQECDPEEVAQRMDISRGAVNAWVYRIRRLARSMTKNNHRDNSLLLSELRKAKVKYRHA